MFVTASDMKNQFGQYLKQTMDENTQFIITKNNKRVARLSPYISDIEKYYTIREDAVDYEYDSMRVSYEEFMEIYEKSNTRMEFINGQIYVISAPGLNHQAILGNLYIIFKDYFKGKKCHPFMAPLDIHFRKKNIQDPDVMQPDLVVLCDLEGNVNAKQRYTGTPSLTLEIISPSSRSIDMVYKLNTFMISGVLEYWVVDPAKKTISVYCFEDCKVDRMEFYKSGETARSFVYEGLSADVGALLNNEIWGSSE